MANEIVEVRQIGNGRAIDFLDEKGELARLVIGPFDNDVRGLVFTEYEGDSSYGRPIFGLGFIVREDGFGLFYDKVFDLKPSRGNKFRVAKMQTANDLGSITPNQEIQNWINGKIPAETV